MFVTYFDEVKPCPPEQKYYLLGGLMIDESVIPQLEQEMAELAIECFGKGNLVSKATEFHAADIASGKRVFKKIQNPRVRFDLLKRLIEIFDKPHGIHRICVGIDPSVLYGSRSPEEFALMYFVERAEELLRRKNAMGLLIGDYEKEKSVSKAVQSLAEYKQDGTPFAFGKDINRILDTVHFAHSHNSRMLQLADVYMWTRQLRRRTDEQSELRADLLKFIREDTNAGWEHKYKYWPPGD